MTALLDLVTAQAGGDLRIRAMKASDDATMQRRRANVNRAATNRRESPTDRTHR